MRSARPRSFCLSQPVELVSSVHVPLRQTSRIQHHQQHRQIEWEITDFHRPVPQLLAQVREFPPRGLHLPHLSALGESEVAAGLPIHVRHILQHQNGADFARLLHQHVQPQHPYQHPDGLGRHDPVHLPSSVPAPHLQEHLPEHRLAAGDAADLP